MSASADKPGIVDDVSTTPSSTDETLDDASQQNSKKRISIASSDLAVDAAKERAGIQVKLAKLKTENEERAREDRYRDRPQVQRDLIVRLREQCTQIMEQNAKLMEKEVKGKVDGADEVERLIKEMEVENKQLQEEEMEMIIRQMEAEAKQYEDFEIEMRNRRMKTESKVEFAHESASIHKVECEKSAKHEAELKKAATEHGAELQCAVAHYEAESKKIADAHNDELKKVSAEHDATLQTVTDTLNIEHKKTTANTLANHDAELAAAKEENARLTALLTQMETKLATATTPPPPQIRYTVDPVSKKKLAKFETQVPELIAKLADTENRLAETSAHLATRTHHHQLTLRDLAQHQHYISLRDQHMVTERTQMQVELLEIGTRQQLMSQKLGETEDKVGRLVLELEDAKEKLAASTQGCEGNADCRSCLLHLRTALRRANAYEQEAGRRLDIVWVEKHRVLEELALARVGVVCRCNSSWVARSETGEMEGGQDPLGADSDSGSDSKSEASEVNIII
ncbi:hypothetical protein P280DRAFT_543438 [Massarina eburnea CBS 473.64]|uniref:Uncharacterized protein n=1 Tax=Massarina eburnea CBS 473.64 TaxID=1395130 RepID=A0A6A6RYQ6_9PLEO|nr:hypothetical protein P280DRAFT_543438 [Massarina eburnea CBS 473.64]